MVVPFLIFLFKILHYICNICVIQLYSKIMSMFSFLYSSPILLFLPFFIKSWALLRYDFTFNFFTIGNIDHSLTIDYLNTFFEKGALDFCLILLRVSGYVLVELLPLIFWYDFLSNTYFENIFYPSVAHLFSFYGFLCSSEASKFEIIPLV